ncbi:response regulator transcription factor [Roseateles sp.]|jgi:two-component system response regulator QseB/two-component system response regulator BasR|uniref:response regulator transcription factor n=1 Tax=Roseateles sp. TaxID=1971397 RepID=UPI0037CADD8A
MRICLIEDDLELGRSLQALLQNAEHEVMWLRRIADARLWLQEGGFDAVVLDLGLPDGDGMELLHRIRRSDRKLPVLIITARDAIENRLEGLDGGADDYLVKPFAGSELLARLRAVIRRSLGTDAADQAAEWMLRDLVLDEPRMEVRRGIERLPLSRTEFSLLLTLVKMPDRVVTRRQLENRAPCQMDGRSLDVHISNLRRKIGEGYIRTVRGVGYLVERH